MTIITLPDGARLQATVTGSGPAVVFVHGFTLDQRQWAPQVAALQDRYTCITYDLRGFGQSDLPTAPYDHVADLLALMAQLRLDRPHLVGLSLGGLIAHVLAARAPDAIASLTLVSAGSRSHVWREPRPVDAVLDFARDHDLAAVRRFWLGLPLFDALDDTPGAREAMATMVDAYSGWHFVHRDLQAPYPLVPGPESISVPTLILRGRRDAQGYFDIGAALAQAIPGARLATYDSCGHMLNLEAPDRFNADLAAHLDAAAAQETRHEQFDPSHP